MSDKIDIYIKNSHIINKNNFKKLIIYIFLFTLNYFKLLVQFTNGEKYFHILFKFNF